MAEGAPLLREYGVYSLIEGSNPSCSASTGFELMKISPKQHSKPAYSLACAGFLLSAV